MSYTIRKTNGTVLGTILDGTADNTKTSLTLVGRNYSNYGQIMTDNLVSIIENFAYNISPTNPLAGQLWWDTNSNLLKVYNGSAYKIVGSCTSQSSAPTTTISGDLWWNSATEQLFVYNGDTPYSSLGWKLIGPVYEKANGKSGAYWETITDDVAVPHSVLSFYLNNKRTSIVSLDPDFVPETLIDGFGTIKTGLTANVSAYTHYITANNATHLGEQLSTSYLRSDEDDTTTGKLTIQNNSGLTLGANSDLTIVATAGAVNISSKIEDKDLSFYANVAGTTTKALTINGDTGLVEVVLDPTTALGVATKQYVDSSFVDSSLLGTPTAITAPSGTNTTQLATTEFVQSAYDETRIISGDTSLVLQDTGSGSAVLKVDNITVMTATASGVNLVNGADATTQPDTYNGTGNVKVATTQFVKTATKWWDGSAKWVSTSAPNPGVNDIGSQDGDIWFQRQA
jgi:hypothetical protein